ncbi:MAG: bifunctional DNA-binding transcriptional regulator/O6-methylguanine-DNA methyltransferase Ada [Anaerolineae bacterium]|nr:bifunctional DNA-binding transcriptional regulator/O6-methylguanine-DNA methyltransferase Ada [Anaerolineae bacterium]
MHNSMKSFDTDQSRWDALTQRDPEAGSAFFYGVTTTGIYCRPGCASRLPKREHVRFFDTCQEAEAAGFRPCKRCTPNVEDQNAAQRNAVIRACEIIQASEKAPALAALAETVGFSPSHFHRLFIKMIGVTPKQYAIQVRADRLRAGLETASTVTDAVYEAGFASSSRFYEGAGETLGMKPAAYRKGGQGMRIRFAIAACDLGWVLIAATEAGICAVEFGDEPQALEARIRARFSNAAFIERDADFDRWVAQLLGFLKLPAQTLDLPLDIQGTAFQRRVWAALRDIPLGTTASYAQIAVQIGNPQAARAVAQACAANPTAVVIPCHRIVRQDGALGGYRWGVERKQRLVEREAQAADE